MTFPALTEEHLIVEVRTSANPDADRLKLTRLLVGQSEDLQEVFLEGRKSGHSAAEVKTRLIPVLDKLLPDGSNEEVAAYLADEYTQVGNSILLISSTTGRAIARLTDEDLYKPSPVPREDGSMVQPQGLRLKPEVEAAITLWVHDRDREAAILSDLRLKQPHSISLLGASERRFLVATQEGRRVLLQSLREALPSVLEEHATGTVKTFLEFFEKGDPPTDVSLDELPIEIMGASIIHPLLELKARNYQHDPYTLLLRQTAAGWVRSLALSIVTEAQRRSSTQTPISISSVSDPEGCFWIGSPDVLVTLQRQHPKVVGLPVDTSWAGAVAVSKSSFPVGYLTTIPESGVCYGSDVFDRWSISATMGVYLRLDWSKVRLEVFEDIPVTGASIELG